MPTRIKHPRHLLLIPTARRHQLLPHNMPSHLQTQPSCTIIPEVHIRQLAQHLGRGEHVDVLDPQGFENVLLEVVVEGHAGDALENQAGPVDVDPVFPSRAGLVDEGLGEELGVGAGELVEAGGAVRVEEFGVEEGVAEARCGGSVQFSSIPRWGHG